MQPKTKASSRPPIVSAQRPGCRPIPTFATETEERAFWEAHDSVDYFDWAHAERVRLPSLKPSTTTISLRLPAGLLDDLKILANERDVPYQSLLKIFLAERVAAERARPGGQASSTRDRPWSRPSVPDARETE